MSAESKMRGERFSVFMGSVLVTQSSALSFYDPVRPHQHPRRNRQADLLGRVQIDH